MKGAWRVCRREYRAYLATPWVYAVLMAFLLLTGLTFYITAEGTREASLRFWFPNLVFVLLVTIPVISSRALAEERRTRHLDALFTRPVDPFGVVFGKWLAITALFTTFLLGTLPYVVLIAAWGSPDWPPLLTSYAGVILAIAMFSAIGTLTSAVTPTSVAAGLASFAALVTLQLADTVDALRSVSYEPHLANFARGAPLLSDIVYFLSGTACCLVVAGAWSVARRALVRARRALAPGALAAVALAANWAVVPVDSVYDVTATGRYTLSSATLDALKNVTGGTITGFQPANSTRARDLRVLLKEYDRANPKLRYRILDFDRHQGVAADLGVTSNDQVVVQVGERRELVDPPIELYITSALQRLSRTGRPVLCSLSGHGERDLDDSGPSGYRTAKTVIESNGILTTTIDLTASQEIQKDCTIIGIFGPRIPLRDNEVKALRAFLDRQGKMVVAREPNGPDLDELTKPYGLRLLPGFVIDPDRGVAEDPRALLVNRLPTESPVVKDVPGAFLVTAGGVTTAATAERGLSVAKLLESSDSAWLELDRDVGKYEPDKGDRGGPVVLAGAADLSRVTGPAIERTRLAVVADVDWASTAFVDELGNRRLLGNLVNWLSGEDDLIAVRGMDPDLRRLELTEGNRRLMGWVSMGVVPGLGGFLGLGLWVVRRRR